MTQYNPYMAQFSAAEAPFQTRSGGVPGWRRMLFILFSIGLIVALLLAIKPTPALNASSAAANQSEQQTLVAEAAVAETTSSDVAQSEAQAVGSGAISPVFAAPVQYWAAQIEAWSAAHGIDPNLAATIMQVESCGDPNAVSRAGAQGLFQVMPFHFTPGENMQDPDTNASRGLSYFVERLQQTGGDIGRAFAGYNGGHRAAATTWDNWPNETQRYYTWTTGIYNEIQQGLNPSPTLQQWLQAGGASLCNQAAARLGLSQ